MHSRALRLAAFCGLALSLLAARSAGCRAKAGSGSASSATPAVTPAIRRGHWITPLLTAPPPRPTPTLWKGVTRVPELPE